MLIHQKPSWRDFQNLEMYVISQATAYPGAQNEACRSHMRTRALFAVFARLAIPALFAIPALLAVLALFAIPALLAVPALFAIPALLAVFALLAVLTLLAAGAPPASPTLLAAGAPPADLAPLQPPLCSRPALNARCHPASQAGPRAPFSSIRPAWSRRFWHGCARCSRSRRDTEQ